MSRVDLFNGVKFIVESNSKEYHSYDDWGLYVTNTDYIKEPKQNLTLVEIPGRDSQLDLSEAVTGRPTYKSRELKITLAGVRNKINWDGVISSFRNSINGRMCRIIFDNDQGYFWRGRIDIKDFSSALNLGKLTIDIPNADPYKYSVITSADPWLWDPFNFETDIITYIGAITVVGSASVTIPHGYMPTCPEFVVSEKTSGTFKVTYDGDEYDISQAVNRIPSIVVGGDQDVTLTFTGTAKVEIVYRSGSL